MLIVCRNYLFIHSLFFDKQVILFPYQMRESHEGRTLSLLSTTVAPAPVQSIIMVKLFSVSLEFGKGPSGIPLPLPLSVECQRRDPIGRVGTPFRGKQAPSGHAEPQIWGVGTGPNPRSH